MFYALLSHMHYGIMEDKTYECTKVDHISLLLKTFQDLVLKSKLTLQNKSI